MEDYAERESLAALFLAQRRRAGAMKRTGATCVNCPFDGRAEDFPPSEMRVRVLHAGSLPAATANTWQGHGNRAGQGRGATPARRPAPSPAVTALDRQEAYPV